MTLVDKSALKNYLKGPLHNFFVFRIAYGASGFAKINRIFKRHNSEKTGLDFIDGSFETLNIKYVCPEQDLNRIPKEGPFIVISNHPYGFLDGLILIRVFGEKFKDFKVLANYFLKLFSPIAHYFIEVDPFLSPSRNNTKGVRETLKHLKDGNPIGIFPSGEVSTYYKGAKYIEDKEWGISTIRLIEKANVPVVPVYFSGQNSRIFHLLGRINPYLRTLSLPREFLKKKDAEVFFRIGTPIKPADYIKSTSEETCSYLRSNVNALRHSSEEEKKVLRLNLRFKIKRPVAIIDPVSPEILEKELTTLDKSQLLLSRNEYDVYYAGKSQITNIIKEIGRLREVTFREVGEGTNKELDLDLYDEYYDQLFVWNREEKEILGGYRLGRGDKIITQRGKKGFYITSLFDLSDEMIPILQKTIEMGRSFVVSKYQRKPFSLFLLWNGIIKYLLMHNKHSYLMGPVSISNDFSRFSKELIMSFIRKYYFNTELAAFVKPRKEFKVKGFREKDVESILDFYKDDLKRLDAYISSLELHGLHIPVLVKKYLSQNAKVIGFNVDPDFNYCLDGLMILDINDLPKESLVKFNA